MLAGQAWAYHFQSGDLCYNITSDSTAEVTKGDNYSELTTITIPEKVTYNEVEYTVTSIGKLAFYDCSNLTSVSIPNSVTSIGESAWGWANKLTKAEFASIESLCRMKFDHGANPLTYAHHLFVNGQEVTEVVIPNSITEIGDYAFGYCDGLTSVTIPETVISIGYEAFACCRSLTSVTIPETVTSISDRAFDGVKNINYSGTATGSPWNALTVNGIFDANGFIYADAAKTQLTAYVGEGGAISIPNSVTSIGRDAFYGCSGVSSIAIPNSVTEIGRGAFEYCKSLTSVVIPESVKSIGYNAFYGCSGLQKAEFATIESLYKMKFDDTYANPLRYAHHLFVNGEEVTEVVIPNTVTEIGKYTFSGWSSLTSVVIPNTVTSIAEGAFKGCDGLTSIELPFIPDNYLGYIFGASKYENNSDYIPTSLKRVVLAEGITKIADNAFRDFSSLDSIIIPESVCFIGEYAFSNCSSLKTITLSKSITKIDHGLFNGCSSLTSVTIPKKVTSIGDYAFQNCGRLSSIIIPKSVESIGIYPFQNCSNLVIYCEADSKPENWSRTWNGYDECPVVWGFVDESEETENQGENENQGGNEQGNENQGGENSNPATAVTESAAANLLVYTCARTIVVENATEEIRVYNAMGALICRDAINRVRSEIPVSGTGAYIVKTGGTVKRVAVY